MSSTRIAGVALLLALAGGRAVAQQDSVVSRPDTTARADTARRVDEHAQDSPDDRGFVIRTSDGRYRLRLLGSVRALAAFDGEGLPSTDGFSPIEIPVPDLDVNNNRFTMEARQSRLGFEATAPLGKKDPNKLGRGQGKEVFARLEMDFRGSGNSLRLRHAFVRIGQEWIVGQTWTTFTDATALPLTVDLDGPNSSVSLRSVQFRASRALGTSWRLAAALESPAADVSVTSDSGATAYQNVPDVIAHVRKVTPTVRLQVAGLFRLISVQDRVEGRTGKVGLGAMVSWLQQLDRGRWSLGAQAIAGKGISRYITGFAGRGLDLVQTTDGEYAALAEAGGYVAIARQWNERTASNVIVGALWALDDGLPDDFYRSGGYLALNHFVTITPGARVGMEAVFGRRRNVDRQQGTAGRLQALFMYDF